MGVIILQISANATNQGLTIDYLDMKVMEKRLIMQTKFKSVSCLELLHCNYHKKFEKIFFPYLKLLPNSAKKLFMSLINE